MKVPFNRASRRFLCGLLLFWPLAACSSSHTPTPQRLRAAYLKALEKDDPEGAYRLLDPQLRAQLSLEEFKSQWEANQPFHAATIAEIQAVRPEKSHVALQATALYRGGKSLRWAQIGPQYLIVSGLPQKLDTSTPNASIRSLLAVMNRVENGSMGQLFSPEVGEQRRAEWLLRSQAIEKALEDENNIKLNETEDRAEFVYGESKRILLHSTETGWRIYRAE